MIYFLAFDSIKIYTLDASQNDCRNPSFVKDINVVGNKMTRNGPEMTISKSCIFFNRTDFTYLYEWIFRFKRKPQEKRSISD